MEFIILFIGSVAWVNYIVYRDKKQNRRRTMDQLRSIMNKIIMEAYNKQVTCPECKITSIVIREEDPTMKWCVLCGRTEPV